MFVEVAILSSFDFSLARSFVDDDSGRDNKNKGGKHGNEQCVHASLWEKKTGQERST